MEIFVNVLLFLHIMGLVLGMGSGMAMSRMGPMLPTADHSQRTMLFSVGKILSMNGHIGLGVLWVTGILMVIFKYQGLASLGTWFWIKMGFVVVLSASIGMASVAYRKLREGQMDQGKRVKMFGMINGICGLGAVFSAVFAFN